MDNYGHSHSPQFRFGLLAAGVLVAVVAGGVAVRMSEARSHGGENACLSVGPGVCQSGSAEWLMENARKAGEMHTEGLPVVIPEAE
jgi:hypothetical protein